MLDKVKQDLILREEQLSRHAMKSKDSKGRIKLEDEPSVRTEFQRDRDRIIHCNTFRRLKHKTQVFIAPTGDHYVTRLTHTLEVAQIGRTIARALNLNEDLTEAICLGHDLGHTPFGHIGEDELNRLHPEGFQHASQSVRVVERLENNGTGLNLTAEVREGIGAHSKPRENVMGALKQDPVTLEAQICRISDAVAYLNHDIGDAIRAGVLSEDDLPTESKQLLGTRHSQRINTLVTDIIQYSWNAKGLYTNIDPEDIYISMSPAIQHAANILREFMFQNVYMPAGAGQLGNQARDIIDMFYKHFLKHPDQVPDEYHSDDKSKSQMVVDYISGMTDYFALRLAEGMNPSVTSNR